MEEFRRNSIKEKKQYTSLLAVREYVVDLAKSCFATYDTLQKRMDEEAEKNEPLKYEFRTYRYHKHFATGCSVSVSGDNYRSNSYESFEDFQNTINNGHAQGVASLTIELNLSYRSGKEGELVDHEHEFKIKFEPAETTLSYEANMEEPEMRAIHAQLQKKLDDFPSTFTIFSRAEDVK